MTYYRTLSLDELSHLEEEFVQFLVINGIVADEWENIKSTDSEKANLIIDQFSEVIFEGVMQKMEFIEIISPKSIKTFQCLSKEMVLVGIDVVPDSSIDFTKQPLNDIKNIDELEVYTIKKSYSKKREHEIFDLMKAGAVKSDGQLFKSLCLLL